MTLMKAKFIMLEGFMWHCNTVQGTWENCDMKIPLFLYGISMCTHAHAHTLVCGWENDL